MKDLAILLVSYDGIASKYCGVGSITQSFIQCMPSIASELANKNIKLTFYLSTPLMNKDAIGYNENIKMESTEIVNKLNGEIIYHLNDTDGSDQFGFGQNWEFSSMTVANIAMNLSRKHESLIVFCQDVPYMKVGSYLYHQIDDSDHVNNVKTIWISHSSGKIHIKAGKQLTEFRRNWESVAINDINKYKNFYLGYIGEYMKKHYVNDYGVNGDKTIPVINGVVIKDKNNISKPITSTETKRILKKYGISLSKPIILSYGRAEPNKGFELLMEAVSYANKFVDFEVVIQASPYRSTDNYPKVLEEVRKKYNLTNCKLVFQFESELINSLTSWDKTSAVVIPSLSEPFGLIPEEIRLKNNYDGPVIIATDIDGFTEQITDGVDGFLCNTNALDMSDSILKSIKLDNKKRQQININGYKRLTRDYNFLTNLKLSINNLI